MPSIKKIARRNSRASVTEASPQTTPAYDSEQTFILPTSKPRGRPRKRTSNNPYGRKGKNDGIVEETVGNASTESILQPSESVKGRGGRPKKRTRAKPTARITTSNSTEQTSDIASIASRRISISSSPIHMDNVSYRVQDADRDGNCYFHSLSFARYGNAAHSAGLREEFFANFLPSVIRGEYMHIMPTTGLPILQHLSLYLTPDGPEETAVQNLIDYAALMRTDSEFAATNDSIIASIVMNRPVVVLHPMVAVVPAMGITWEDAERIRAEIFFPDGDFMRIIDLDRNDVRQMGLEYTVQDEYRERIIRDALVMWHDGLNHFQPFIYQAHPSGLISRSPSIAGHASIRRSARLATIRQTSLERSVTPNLTSFGAIRMQNRRDNVHLRSQNTMRKTRQRKGIRRCKHPDVGCWANDSGHEPPAVLDLGHFGDKICDHCGAWLLPSESSRHCCAHGSVRVDDFRERVPDVIVDLLSRHARETYAYNTMLAMASTKLEGDEVSDGRVCMLNGNLSHKIADLSPVSGRSMFNELYCLNPAEAHAERQRMDIFSDKIDEQLLIDLDAYLRANNVLAREFTHSYELWTEAKEEAERLGQPLPAYTMVIMQKRGDPGPDAARIRPPAPNEVSFVYRMPPDEALPNLPRGLRMVIRESDPQRAKTLREVRYWDPNMAPLLYPLLFPFGQPGFRKGIPTVRLRQSARRKKTQQIVDEVAVEVTDEQADECDSVASGEDEDTADIDLDEVESVQEPQRNVPKPREGPLKNISQREYYRYIIQTRGPPTEIDNDSTCHFPIWSTRFLGQKFLIEMMWNIEHQEAYYAKKFQDEYRMSTAKEFLDALERGLPIGSKLGRCYFTPASYQGSKRHMQKAFNDALSIAREVGTPVFFVTFTPSPAWEVLKDVLKPGETTADRPDLICRAFIAARRELWKDLEERGVLGGAGSIVGHAESLEFQEKGLPHIHKLLCIDKGKVDVNNAEFVDRYVTAEFMPRDEAEEKFGADVAENLYEHLYPLLVHTCSERCKPAGKPCKYGFPQPFSQQTVISPNRKPIFRRRSPADGGAYLVLNGRVVDNRWVVPHNLPMLLKYECHLCIEPISGDEIFILQYIFKYLFKGTDMCYVDVTKKRADQQGGQVIYDYDEYSQVFTCRRMGPHEAFMRMYQEPFVRLSHTVKPFSVHKPDEQHVQFRGGEELDVAGQVAAGEKKTAFMAYFELCAGDKNAAKYTFAEFGKHYRWVDKKEWQKYKRTAVGEKAITRIYPVSPSDHERFALRLLASHVTGMCAFRSKLPSINAYKVAYTDDGQPIHFETFVQAAEHYGLLESDDIWIHTLEEASDRLRGARRFTTFFGQLLLFGEPADPRKLFDRFFKRMVNYRRYDELTVQLQEEMRQVVLRRLKQIFTNAGKCCGDFGIPEPDNFDAEDDFYYDFPVVPDQPVDDADDQDDDGRTAQQMINTMNQEQFDAFNQIMEALQRRRTNVRGTGPDDRRLFWITGEGGTGKSYVIETLIKQCKEDRFNIIVTATTGRAASLLPSGRTVHSAFGLSIDKTAPQRGQPYEGAKADTIRQIDLIIIDEISMMDRRDFEHVNRLCKDYAVPPILNLQPFAAKVVVICGDFDQLLTVVAGGRAADQVDACLRRHDLWPTFEEGRIHLRQNMRLEPGEEEFNEWLQDIRKGRNFIRIEAQGPGGWVGPVKVSADRMVDSPAELINKVFDCDLSRVEEIASRVIFAPVNRTIDEINQKILAKLPGQQQTFFAVDQLDPSFAESIQEDGIQISAYQSESLHRISAGTLPHYRLDLKIGAMVMLLRNIDVSRGLANGTRLIITNIGQFILDAKIIRKDGTLATNTTYIGKAKNYHQTRGFRDVGGLKMIRTQFPVKLCFATTINKGQGTTATGRVGLDLSSEVFQPGQLYTAVSRLTKKKNLFVYNGRPRLPDEDGEVRNIIWKWE